MKIKKLRQEEIKIRKEINRIEDNEIELVVKPRLKLLIGKCYAYRGNNYSCPKKASDYWDVFRKIIDWVDTKERGFYFICEEFSIDSNGLIDFEVNNHSPYLNKEWWGEKIPFSGYEEITEKEYMSEKLKILEEMKTQKKMRKVLKTKY